MNMPPDNRMDMDPGEWNLRAARPAAPIAELPDKERLGAVRPPLPPLVLLERRGPSYRVTEPEVKLEMTFRDVQTGGELSADVAVGVAGRHLFRTTTTLSLTARDKLAKTAAEFSGATPAMLRRALFAAVEAVLAAEDQVGAPVDLRFGSLALPAGGLHVARPLWPTGNGVLVSPGDAGKST
ncbi:MAG TPA: hypothetical protein VNF73_09680, partial [Candidatus Saccharimonadales bacterium]|nr:hypothetical protein [Candidatus Saccharimonadales bacterium]